MTNAQMLNQALLTLKALRLEVHIESGGNAAWLMLNHAWNYLNEQLAEELHSA